MLDKSLIAWPGECPLGYGGQLTQGVDAEPPLTNDGTPQMLS